MIVMNTTLQNNYGREPDAREGAYNTRIWMEEG